jgi:hypothetical protein
MKKMLIGMTALLAVALSACGAGTATAPAPSAQQIVVRADPCPGCFLTTPAQLKVLDASTIKVTLSADVLTVALTDDKALTWHRLVLADKTISPITRLPGGNFMGLGGTSSHSYRVNFQPGMSFETAGNPLGPWTVAATTQ